MTTSQERCWSVLSTREFLFALLDPKQTPRVPREIRKRASRCLRHYPSDADLRDVPRAFGK